MNEWANENRKKILLSLVKFINYLGRETVTWKVFTTKICQVHKSALLHKEFLQIIFEIEDEIKSTTWLVLERLPRRWITSGEPIRIT